MSVRGDFRGLDRLLRGFERLTRPGALVEVSRAAAEGAMGALHDRFRTATDPYGQRWKPSLRAQLEGGQTLSDTGRLRRSFSVQNVSPRGFAIGTNVIYAATHQFGATIRPKRARFLRFRLAGGQGPLVFAKEVRIPPRPFLPTGPDLGEYGPRMAEAVRAWVLEGF